MEVTHVLQNAPSTRLNLLCLLKMVAPKWQSCSPIKQHGLKNQGWTMVSPQKKSPSQEKDTETTLSQLGLAKVTREALPLDEEQK